LEAQIKRADEVEPTINAICANYYDEAMDQAKQAEAKYSNSASDIRPLEGLTIAIKDESELEGKISTSGSLILKDYVAEETSYANQRILDAGGIVHTRTTTPEFCCAGTTHSKRWGVSRNPWNSEFTCGGSSGGSGASLAAGTTTLATGSDIGGSIRIPASCNGVVGFKPPYGRVPEGLIFNLDTYNHNGPMARNVDDCRLLENVMAGPHPKDIATIKPKLEIPENLDDIKGWRIAYSMDLGFVEVDEDVRNNTLQALKTFESLGARVEEVKLGWTQDCATAGMNYLKHLFGGSIAELLEEHSDIMTNYARNFALDAGGTTSSDFLAAQEMAGIMYNEFGPMIEDYDLFICPTTSLPAVPADQDPYIHKVEINGKEVDPFLGWVMTYPFNILSRCPVMSVPSGFAKNGVPTGIQLIARTYDDTRVFQAAKAFEAATGWYGKGSPRPQFN